ncbi:hypothetical protein Cni_G25121 [Canna indica]|uniref:Reverse transcriptase n=1 Tax=Canna indica TaxID=4628 RepID=A0AAQ3QM20_9LILI|nr:hypothetical protein Cni_G25121 [Canna indica]
MKDGSFPMQYLGDVLTPKRLSLKLQNKICEKVDSKIDHWAKDLLSQAGKTTMTNIVICAIPVYTLMTSWVNEKVCEKIDTSAMSFFWAKDNNMKSAMMVSWKRITASRKNGGLSLREAAIMKKVMNAKKIFELMNEEDKLWVSIYKEKYDIWHPWKEKDKWKGS